MYKNGKHISCRGFVFALTNNQDNERVEEFLDLIKESAY